MKMIFVLYVAMIAVETAISAEHQPEIWFKPLTWDIKPNGGGLEYARHDFPALLHSDAQWSKAASSVATLVLPGNVVWSYPNPQELVSFVGRHKWRFALVLGVQFTRGTCKALEGMSQDSDVNRESVGIVKRWHEVAGPLDYVIMDGPRAYAMASDGCHLSVDEAARRASATVRRILAEYPYVRIVDSEGTGMQSNSQWLADMHQWLNAFRAASGTRIDSVLLDLNWRDPRPGNTLERTVREAVEDFEQTGVSTGLLINADNPQGTTPDQWMAANREHIHAAVEGHLGLDYIDIDEWMNVVQYNLPESDPHAYTSLVNVAENEIKRSYPR